MLYDYFKRTIDIVSGAVLAILFFPIILLAAAAIKLDSKGPIFYNQKRMGKKGQYFWIYKLRTMVAEADDILVNDKQFQKKYKKRKGWKLSSDEDFRVTRVGKWLRRFTVDEFPQLINVLKGEMSLVGPRAFRDDLAGNEIEEHLKNYPKMRAKVKTVLSVKPGITGPWQTSGRNVIPFDKRIEMEYKYAKRKNLLDDILIIFKTPLAMVTKW